MPMAGRRFGPRKFSPRRLTPQQLTILLIVVVLVALARWWQPEAPPPDALAPGVYEVKRVVDGDTLVLANGARVRLIGADTPETVKPNHPIEPWGPEASDFTREFVASGEVRLEFDREVKDKYGRFLAYVWVDDRMLNEELIRAGLARAEPQYHYAAAVKKRFLRAEADARAAGRGIWSRRAVPVP